MLVLPEQEYEEKKESLLEVVGWLMKMSRDDSIKQGSWCRKWELVQYSSGLLQHLVGNEEKIEPEARFMYMTSSHSDYETW